jgi:hypothetical protein
VVQWYRGRGFYPSTKKEKTEKKKKKPDLSPNPSSNKEKGRETEKKREKSECTRLLVQHHTLFHSKLLFLVRVYSKIMTNSIVNTQTIIIISKCCTLYIAVSLYFYMICGEYIFLTNST